MSLRTEIIAQLATIAPESFEVHRGMTPPARIQRTTLVLAQDGISRTPQAPAVGLTCAFRLYLVSHFEDLVKAEEDLDDNLAELLDVLDETSNLEWQACTRVALDDRLPAYEITISTLIARTQK